MAMKQMQDARKPPAVYQHIPDNMYTHTLQNNGHDAIQDTGSEADRTNDHPEVSPPNPDSQWDNSEEFSWHDRACASDWLWPRLQRWARVVRVGSSRIEVLPQDALLLLLLSGSLTVLAMCGGAREVITVDSMRRRE
jgi:hypothetical protein